MSRNTKFDVHQEITNRIVDAIETAGEFRLPWIKTTSGSFAHPVNIASRKPYNGVNIVSLWVSALASEFPSNVWVRIANGRRRAARSARARNPHWSSFTRPSTLSRSMTRQVKPNRPSA